ncbi:MAG: cellulase family glycosylhydrolase, partial [Lachnospiraceae bacterium]|nr:cellulase family glycosylhydrolase [Lachnospiraceae bacterium]
MREFVKVRGKKFYKGDEEILFKGIGIGSWLNLEHFMMGLPGNDFQIRQSFTDVYGKKGADRFFDTLVKEFVSEADFCFMKELGINLVRVPFNYRLFMDDEKPGEWRQTGFDYFDYLFRLAEQYEIYVLPDLHAVPGGQNPDWHSDNGTGYTLFWQYGVFRQQMVMLWKEIATRYRDEVYLLGYDILNEPFIIPDR